jgi:hypothetical protein
MLAGLAGPLQVGAALAAGVLLWGLSFALGFRAFARGLHANGLGLFLTLGLPLAAFCCERGNLPGLAALLPPGSVYAAVVRTPGPLWAVGPVVTGALTLLVTRRALARCEPELRQWYEAHHGRRVMS